MATAKKQPAEETGTIQVASIDDLRVGKKPLTRKLTVYLDDEHHEAFREARAELDRATTLAKSNSDKYADRLEAAEAELERLTELVKGSAREVHFKAIGRKRYDELIRQPEHRATDEQHEDFAKEMGNPKARAPFNGDTFPQALVAESMYRPDLSLEDVQEIFETWNSAEINELFGAAMEVNTGRRSVELGK